MLYESLVGAWPLGLSADDAAGVAALEERVAAWQEKALREGKRHTGWAMPNEAYETACRDFLHQVMSADRAGRVLQEVADFVERVAAPGVVNSLSQLLLRLTSPGVPDLYQGTEYWDFSLVDPDNRRPVDFAARQASLDAAEPAGDLLRHWKDGRVKQAVLTRALHLRGAMPGLFTGGSYVPMKVEGPAADHVIAFARVHEGYAAMTVVTRLPAGLSGIDALPLPDPSAWDGTTIVLPRNFLGRRSVDVLLGSNPGVELAGRLPVADILSTLPVALLEVR